jgi:hypothetical protein
MRVPIKYISNSGQAGQSENAIEGTARAGVHTPPSRLSSVSAGFPRIFLEEVYKRDCDL